MTAKMQNQPCSLIRERLYETCSLQKLITGAFIVVLIFLILPNNLQIFKPIIVTVLYTPLRFKKKL